jgi:ribosomal subunit interface protein
MTIQFSSAHNVRANEELKTPIIELLGEKLHRFKEQISRLDVHLSDENANKEGPNDKRCVLEAHLDGKQPVVAKNHANSYASAAEGAADKLKSALDSTLGRLENHHQH